MAGPTQAWLGRVVPGPAEFSIGLQIFTPANRNAGMAGPAKRGWAELCRDLRSFQLD
jgi:hypothetical protein